VCLLFEWFGCLCDVWVGIIQDFGVFGSFLVFLWYAFPAMCCVLRFGWYGMDFCDFAVCGDLFVAV